ncbi:MAG: hypothetical protein LCH95_04205 [Proteobacteria bacterium]|nr:hypothetical protein [Pseudomonadota bacterium]
MRGNWFRVLVLPLLLAAGLGACASGAVQPGIVHTSGPQAVTVPATPPGGVQQASYPSTYPAQGSASGAIGDTGRVVSIREVGLAGGSRTGGGSGNGAFLGGLLGAGAGATIGSITSNSAVGGLVGALIGAVGGAIAGTIADGQRGPGRGIEVTVQRDDGQQVTVAQSDDGDIQLGDRVQIVQNRQGVAQVVRAQQRTPD